MKNWEGWSLLSYLGELGLGFCLAYYIPPFIKGVFGEFFGNFCNGYIVLTYEKGY